MVDAGIFSKNRQHLPIEAPTILIRRSPYFSWLFFCFSWNSLGKNLGLEISRKPSRTFSLVTNRVPLSWYLNPCQLGELPFVIFEVISDPFVFFHFPLNSGKRKAGIFCCCYCVIQSLAIIVIPSQSYAAFP